MRVCRPSDGWLSASGAGLSKESGVGGIASSVDDAQFYFTPGDVLVQFRSARRGNAPTDFGANRRRLEKMRIALGYEKLPVLRNRRRSLVVIESPLDSFGPPTNSLDALGFTAKDIVPAEVPLRQLYEPYGDTDPRAPSWKPPSAQMRGRRADDLGEQLNALWLREADDRVEDGKPLR
jgi:hypothetical protein